MITKKFDHSIKTIIVGDSSVGKTCILLRYVNDTFEDRMPNTLGVEFLSRIVQTEKHRIELQLWDTAGQELFRAVTRSYYHGTAVAFIAFDLTQRDTFEHVTRWYNDVKEVAPDSCMYVLIGNKSDQVEQRAISKEQAQELAATLNVPYFETSAKEGINVTETIQSALNTIEDMIDQGKFDNDNESDVFTFAEEAPKTSSCC